MWMGSAADIICSGHGPADGLQEERQQMLRINQLKLKVGHSERTAKEKTGTGIEDPSGRAAEI